jgi:hypothetical protein
LLAQCEIRPAAGERNFHQTRSPAVIAAEASYIPSFPHYIRIQPTEIRRIGQAKLNALYLPVLKHLRQRNVLAQRGFQVKPVPFPRNKLHAPAALADGAEEIVWFGYV